MAFALANRPEPGRLGEPYEVQANLFEVRNFPKDVIMHYDVIQSGIPREKEGEEERKNVRRLHKIMHRLQNSAPEIFRNATAYDGAKNLFTLKDNLFKEGSMTVFTVNRSDRPAAESGATRSFDRVTLKKVGEIRPAELDKILKGLVGGLPISTTPLQALNVFVQQAAALKFPVHTRQKFFIEDGKVEASSGLEIWRGFFQSVRPSPGRLLVNVDMASSVMFGRGPLIKFLLAFFNMRDSRELSGLSEGNDKWSRMKMILSGVQVIQKPKDRLRTIKSLVPNAGFYEFTTKDGNITVQDYFRRHHHLETRFPKMPGICTTRGEVIPFEFCDIKEGQLYKKRASPELMARMLAFSKKKPAERLAVIQNGMQRLQIETSPFVMQAGLHISSTPMTVRGRILDPPAMSYGGNVPPQKPKSGSWNMVGRRLKDPMPIETWAVVCFAIIEKDSVQRFIKSLKEAMASAGIGIHSFASTGTCPDNNSLEVVRNDPEIERANPAQVQNELGSICGWMQKKFKAPPTMIVVILPQNAAPIKKDVKRFGDVLHGMVTQCVREDKVTSANNQYCNNLILKINAKLGGVNTVPSGPAFDWFSQGKTMIIGADVTHPGPGVLRPSIASLVSSVDSGAAKYVACSTIQEPRLEIIQGIKGMVKDALDMFNKYRVYINKENKGKIAVVPVWPEQIIFYRDGVSEGEIQQVAEEEIKQISDLLELMRQHKGIKPKLTFIVVGKRHHVRFFPKDGGDRSGNAPAGLVVDKDIISPGIFDFYLQSHAGLLGTSRPSHYIVVKDENNFTSDEQVLIKGIALNKYSIPGLPRLQSFSFVLCHTYARATRSVSIPAPCYYADIVCARADYHFNSELNYSDDLSSGGEFNLKEWKEGFGGLHKNHHTNMYFM